jgi:xanthine dehydrogenase accessory factor
MNFSLLDKIETTDNGILATVLGTEGHTYKKRGARALFAPDRPGPVWGNLGSLCVDQELVRAGHQALADEKPRLLEIDTSKARDIDFGYGTYCGGRMDILIEPLLIKHKAVYSVLRERLRSRTPCYLAHDIDSGDLALSDTAPEPAGRVFVEEILPLRVLCIFGATPLTRRVIHHLEGMDFEVHVVDWRPAHIDGLIGHGAVTCHRDDYTVDGSQFVLVQSHDFRRDKQIITEALKAGCGYIGMLSSKTRRDQMYKELREEGLAQVDIDRISSPVGLNIGGRTDAEIAISIVAELVTFSNNE